MSGYVDNPNSLLVTNIEITWKLLSRIHFWTRVDILDTRLKRMRIQVFWIPVRKKNTYLVVLDTCSKKEYVSGCSGPTCSKTNTYDIIYNITPFTILVSE